MSAHGIPELDAAIRQEIRDAGAITFARFMELALYHPTLGYYNQPDCKPGRSGDFITAPELHPFFGMTLALQVADCWDALGQPAHFVVREHGASVGGLAWDIVAALSATRPDVIRALDYRLIEINPHRAAESARAMAEGGLGHLVRPESPAEITPEVGMVIANEVADALPAHRLVVTNGALQELWVRADGDGYASEAGELSPEVVRAEVPAHLASAGVDVGSMPEGAELDVSPAAARWLGELAANLPAGLALIIDYGYDAPTLYSGHRLGGTVRAYHAHTVTDDPYIRVGQQDLTAHVDFTALAMAGQAAGLTPTPIISQAELLTNLGIGAWLMRLQADAETTLEEYYQAQAATMRLIDPTGLGRFRAIGLHRGLAHAPAGWRGLTLDEQIALANPAAGSN